MAFPRHFDKTREPVVESCIGCTRVDSEGDITYCQAYVRPAVWWMYGRYCPLATHYKLEAAKQAKINPLKASKRASKKKK